VVLLTDEELWDTIAVNWCKPGKETIRGIVDTWEGRDLAACVFRLGLPVLYAKKNYVHAPLSGRGRSGACQGAPGAV